MVLLMWVTFAVLDGAGSMATLLFFKSEGGASGNEFYYK
jgi:hypothetical protein